MQLRTAEPKEFSAVRDFYWELIDLMRDQSGTIGWKKGIYPSDALLSDSLARGELFVLKRDGRYAASVILNSKWNEGYAGLPWSIDCPQADVLVPHALAVHPKMQRRGIGKAVVRDVIDLAKSRSKKTVRLDILGENRAAERLYTAMGFRFVQSKTMFYPDTGWTEYEMYELIL